MRGSKRVQGGFALIELLIILALLGVVIGVVYQFFFFGLQSYAHAEAEADIQQQAQTALQQMEAEVRNGIIANSDNKAVSVSSDRLTIYTNMIGEPKPVKITYQVQEYPTGSKTYRLLKCMQRALNASFPYSYPSLPALPSNDEPDRNSYKYDCWMTAIKRIDNNAVFSSQPDSIFRLSDARDVTGNPKQYAMSDIIIQVDVKVNDRKSPLKLPVELKTVLAVRSQGGKAL